MTQAQEQVQEQTSELVDVQISETPPETIDVWLEFADLGIGEVLYQFVL